MTTLHLGVVDLPYVEPPTAKPRTAKPKRRARPKAATSQATTGDVAEWLENKYGVMQHFWEARGQQIADAVEHSLAGAIETMAMGGPASANPFGTAEGLIKDEFNKFLDSREIEHMGIPGVPTQAALRGVNHRMKNKQGGRRPSFIDTGLYEFLLRRVVHLMATLDESATNQSQMKADLIAGLDTLSLNQTITFTKYVRLVLPLDGFVFWVRADLVSVSALLNVAKFNQVTPNDTGAATAPLSVTVKGSLHYASNSVQREDENFSINQVVFTAQSEIQAFNDVGPSVIYIGAFDGIRFAFSRRNSLYRQAGIFHYVGDAIYPAMESQIIDSVAGWSSELVVSNSLPIWLSLNKLMPMFPSYSVPENLPPPYASVHIPPTSTTAIQSAPYLDRRLTHSQLVSDKVSVTVYGLRNNAALDFQDYVFSYSLATDNIGIMNMPVIRDEKRTQNELDILAMKKTIEFDVSYYQTRVADLARQLILSCIPTFIIDGYVPPVPPEFFPGLDFRFPRNGANYYFA